MKNRTLALVAVLALALAACGGDSSDETTTTEGAAATSTTEAMTSTTEGMTSTTEEMMDENTVLDLALSSPDFETLVAAVQAAGLEDALADPDATLTVFAPTNDAFAAALDALGLTAEELLADTETLTTILTYHVLGEVVTSGDIVAAGVEQIPVDTLAGEALIVTVGDDGTVGFDGQTAVVTMADLEASNGVIHVIDAVLLPPSMSN